MSDNTKRLAFSLFFCVLVGVYGGAHDGFHFGPDIFMKTTTVLCRVSLTDVLLAVDNDGEDFVDQEYVSCLRIDEHGSEATVPLEIDELPIDFVNDHASLLETGELFAKLSNVYVEATKVKFMLGISSVEPYSPALSKTGAFRRRKLNELPTSLAWIRVSMQDAPFGLSHDELHQINAIDTPNTGTQLHDISFGKLDLQLKVVDVFVDEPPSSYNNGMAAAPDVVQALIEQHNLSSADELADKAFLCIPDGMQGNWVGIATRNGWLAVFNDSWCYRLSVLIHEFGHLVGLGHSSLTPGDQNDKTCYMSRSAPGTNAPAQTFNSHKSYRLGFYDDRVDFINPEQSHLFVELANFVDYELTLPSQPVIVVIGGNEEGYFLHYNRQKGFNHETRQMGDLVVVTRALGSNSNRLAGLDVGDSWTLEDLGAEYSVKVEVCQFVEGVNATTPDRVIISIARDSESLCGSTFFPSQSPTSTPVLSPSSSPSGHPHPSPIPPTTSPSSSLTNANLSLTGFPGAPPSAPPTESFKPSNTPIAAIQPPQPPASQTFSAPSSPSSSQFSKQFILTIIVPFAAVFVSAVVVAAGIISYLQRKKGFVMKEDRPKDPENGG